MNYISNSIQTNNIVISKLIRTIHYIYCSKEEKTMINIRINLHIVVHFNSRIKSYFIIAS